MKEPRLIPVGKIVKPHGVRGAVKIYSYGETLGELEAGEKLFCATSGGKAGRELTIVGLRVLKQGWIGEFAELANIDLALEMAGKEIYIPEDRLPVLPDGEYYHYQLIGLTVETEEGRDLGKLRSIIETGAHDVYVVGEGAKELLVPAIEDVIRRVDLREKKIIVELPEGLEEQP